MSLNKVTIKQSRVNKGGDVSKIVCLLRSYKEINLETQKGGRK